VNLGIWYNKKEKKMKKRYAWLLDYWGGKIHLACGTEAVLRIDKRCKLVNSIFGGIKHLNRNCKVKYVGVRDHCEPLCYWVDSKYKYIELDINM
jgi:hypothetical protein